MEQKATHREEGLSWRTLTPADLAAVRCALVEQSLKDERLEAMPDDETLIRFASGLLKGEEARVIHDLINTNFAATFAAADIMEEYAGVRVLVLGWGGWKGAYLAAVGKLPEGVTTEQWDECCERSPEMRQRTRWMESLFGASDGTPAPKHRGFLLSGALGWGLAVVFGVLYIQAGFFNAGLEGVETRGMNAPAHLNQPSGPVSREIEELVFPTPSTEVLQARIDDWEVVLKKHPEDLSTLNILLRFHRDLARLTTDPEVRADSEQRAAELEADLLAQVKKLKPEATR